MEKETVNKIYKGMVVTGAIGALALFLNSSSRKKMVASVKCVKDTTVDAVSFVRDNREQLVSHLKVAANDISSLIKDVNQDMKVISESASHIKQSSSELMRTTQEMANEFKSWKENDEKK